MTAWTWSGFKHVCLRMLVCHQLELKLCLFSYEEEKVDISTASNPKLAVRPQDEPLNLRMQHCHMILK